MSVETIRSIASLASPEASGAVERVGRASQGEAAGRAADGGSFADSLAGAIQKVDQIQVDADVQAEKVAMGGGNLHEMSLALEKADVAMRLAMKVRNKVVEAYQEIMRMSV